MPNVACNNTSSFLKSNCKYVEKDCGVRESKPAKQQRWRWDGGGRDRCLSEGIMAKLTQACVFEICAEALDGQNRAGTWSGVWWQNWCWPLRPHVNKQKVLKTLIWQKKTKKKKSDITTWIHAVRPGQWKEKANWKQSKYVYFSVSLISFSCSCFRIGDGSDDTELVNHMRQWEDIGDSSTPTRPCRGRSGSMLAPLPPSSDCLGPATLLVVKSGSDWWSHCKKEINWIWSAQFWPADRYDGHLRHNGGL